MYTLMSLVLHSSDLATVARSLHARVQQAPNFFANTPVIVDFSQVPVSPSYNFKALFKVVRQQQLLPVAVRGLPEKLSEQLQVLGVPVVEHNSPQAIAPEVEQVAEPDLIVGKPGKTLFVERPLRAGQRCYAPDADLVIVGECGADNELIADGNIHVYGVLRGTALCGMQGNRDARIFCTGFDAKKVSIAGVTLSRAKVSDVPGSEQALQVKLVAGVIEIRPLIDKISAV